MELRQKQVIEAYQRVQDFIDTHPVPPPASYAGPKELLDKVVAGLTRHTVNQAAGGRQWRAETDRERALVRALRETHLRPISKIAKAVLRDAPGIDKAVHLPARRIPVTRLVAEARAIRIAVTPYEEVFVASGRPADFLARLDGAIETLLGCSVGRARNVGAKVGARRGITEQISRGRDAVEMLDAIVTTSFAGDLDTLAQWRVAKRVKGVSGGGFPAATGGTADENLPPRQAA